MLYIHRLPDLNDKSLEIESIPIIREIRRKANYPLSEDFMKKQFSPLFASLEEKREMEETLPCIQPAIEKVNAILKLKDPVYESDNLLRTIQILQELPVPLQNNIAYAELLLSFQQEFIAETTLLLNAIPSLKTLEEKQGYNEKLSNIFQTLLRNNEFFFNFQDIINESHVNHMKGLIQSLEKGYLFYHTVEEELEKTPFEVIKLRLSQWHIDKGEEIYKEIVTIKKGIDAAYAMNIHTLHLSIFFYSYVKWISSK